MVCDGFCFLASADSGAGVCTASTAVAYDTTANCLTECAGFAVGINHFETSGNSLGCRTYHLRVAAASDSDYRTVHCPHASSSGGNVCVGNVTVNCFGFCTDAINTCADQTSPPYASFSECKDFCSTFTSGDLTPGQQTETSGDTLGCRSYHLSVAMQSASDADTHCAHIGQQTGGYCGTYCENMCTTIQAACVTDSTYTNQQYASKAACVTSCGAMVDGTSETASEDSRMCRNYHAKVSWLLRDQLTGAGIPYQTAHCPHTGILGGTVCGADRCEPYCRTVMSACITSDTAQFSSVAQCMAVCKAFNNADHWGDEINMVGAITTSSVDYTSNTLACRAYHADVAITTPDPHCAHAGALGGGVCSLYDSADPLVNIYNSFCVGMDGSNADGFCTGSNEQYADAATCVAAARMWKMGDFTGIPDTRGNSLACRVYHAGVASVAAAAALHCPHAGAMGTGGCESQCPAFCYTQAFTCGFGSASVTLAQFSSMEECLAVCETWTVGGKGLLQGEIPDSSYAAEATSACREYHLSVANSTTSQASTHCKHTGFTDSTNTCRAAADTSTPSNCYSFCDVVTAACFGTNMQYDTYADCLTECIDFDHAAGARGDTDGDSYNCRMTHAINALQNVGARAVQCPYVKASSSVCVVSTPTCAAFCAQAMTTCTGINTQFSGSTTKCLTRCATWSTGTIADRLTNTLGCRQYHLNVAASNTSLLAAHCPHIGMADTQSQCGSRCDAFCALAIGTCTSTYGTPPYATLSACTTACANFAFTGNTDDLTGDTFQCREHYLGVAADATTDVSTKKTDNCPYIRQVSTQCASSTGGASSSTGMMSSTGGGVGAATSLQVSVALLASLIAALVAFLA